MLHAAIVRSTIAHARIVRVDVTAARSFEGVVDCFGSAEIGAFLRPLPCRVPPPPALEPFVQLPLASGRVRYVGEPVAVVVATSRYVAEDAAELVEVEYEPLPAIVDVAGALDPDAPELFEGASNLVHSVTAQVGDVTASFGRADVIVEHSFRVARQSAVPLETRGLVARYEPDDRLLEVWGTTKMPHYHRDAIAAALGLDPQQVHLHSVDVGGGFGPRGELHPEDVLIPLAAFRNGQAVQWLEDRTEHLVAMDQAREQSWEARVALTADGVILGLDARISVDFGAYVRTLADAVPFLSTIAFLGPYRVPNYRCIADCVLTNKTGVGPMRSPGRYQANFVRERLLDLAATRLGVDPVELRLRNLVQPDEMPYATGFRSVAEPMVYDGGDYPRALLEAVGAVSRPTAVDTGASTSVGVGVASFVEGSGFGPFEAARVRVTPDGNVAVFTGTSSMGQGHTTTFAQIAAEALGTSPDRIHVYDNDTAVTPEGIGTFASRTAIMGGNAVWIAASKVRDQLGGALDELGPPETPLEAEADFRTDTETFTYGASAAVVEVDVQLGIIRVLAYALVVDAGNVVNPMIVRGQLAGAAVQGIGSAILEELAYSPDGQPLATTFMDYLLPTSLDTPKIEAILLDTGPSPGNPLGVRGIGEIGITAVGATLATAVANALGEGGASILQLPLKPDDVRRAATARPDPSGSEPS
jgi:aerobic carbon-monoxide dehydrogenase large subunit